MELPSQGRGAETILARCIKKNFAGGSDYDEAGEPL